MHSALRVPSVRVAVIVATVVLAGGLAWAGLLWVATLDLIEYLFLGAAILALVLPATGAFLVINALPAARRPRTHRVAAVAKPRKVKMCVECLTTPAVDGTFCSDKCNDDYRARAAY